jgi:hypothetical protein
MEIAACIRGASKEYKAGNTVITALQPTTMEELKMLSDSGKSVIVVTHDLRLKPFGDRKEQSKFNEKRAELVYKKIELINNSGGSFVIY